MAKPVPFNFVLDILCSLEIEIKPMFGMFAIYSGEKILMMLRQQPKFPERNGLWVAINPNHVGSINEEFPFFAVIAGLHKKSEIEEWRLIRSGAEEFETSAIEICELISKGDMRFGHIPKARRIGQ